MKVQEKVDIREHSWSEYLTFGEHNNMVTHFIIQDGFSQGRVFFPRICAASAGSVK